MTQTITRHIEPVLLARRGASIVGVVEPALCDRLAGLQAPITVDLRFEGDTEGRPLASGLLEARVESRCERCLQPMEIALAPAVHWRFLRPSDPPPAEVAPFEDVDLDGTEVDLVTLVEDELLLALPPFPRHAYACGEEGTARHFIKPQPTAEPAPGRKRPFSGLASLLGRQPGPGTDDGQESN
ncbi:MAG TPA: hypothetical protein DCY89_07200 [Gammaproteobacteria bacterium]|nr:hypothetical protein [Gammaproteobacteria bacterium]